MQKKQERDQVIRDDKRICGVYRVLEDGALWLRAAYAYACAYVIPLLYYIV